MTGRLLFGLLVCLLPSRTAAQAVDSLDTIYEADDLPPESALEESAIAANRAFALVWRSAWSRSMDLRSDRHGLRAVFTTGQVVFRIRGDHDPGEPLRTRPVPTGFDHLLASVDWRPVRGVQIVAGSFRRHFFQGLVAGSERFGSPASDATGSTRPGPGIRSWAGASEDVYHHGLAFVTRPEDGLAITTWISRRKLDAALDTVASGVLARWARGGVHDTALSRSRRETVTFREAGIAVEFERRTAAIGAVVARQSFSLPLCPKYCSGIGIYRPGGIHSSIYARVGGDQLRAAVECRLLVRSCAGALRARRVRRGSVLIMARQYPRARGPLMASPPSSGGHVEQGESGVLIGGHLVLGTGWAVALSADQSAVSEGDERWLFRGVRVDQRIGIRARGTGWEADAVLIRAVRTVREDAGLGQGTRRTHRHRMRIRLRVPITTSGIVTLGGDWALLDRPLRSGSTVLTAALDWRPGARLRCRIGLTDHLVARGSRPVIVYEADTPLAYPLRSLSGSGRRLYGLVSWTSGDTTLSIAASRGVRDRIDPLASPDRSSAISVALASGI